MSSSSTACADVATMLSVKERRNRRTLLMTSLMLVIALGLAACERVSVLAMNTVETSQFRVDGPRLYLSGAINSKTLDQFNAIYAAHPGITTLVELEVPGSVDDDTMIALGYRVRDLGLDTHLTAQSEVHSGGVDLFLAGVNRTIEPGAVIGVHSWSDGTREAKDVPRSAPEHEMNRRYIEVMLGKDEFYWFTIYAAPADGIHIMTQEEIRTYGLTTR